MFIGESANFDRRLLPFMSNFSLTSGADRSHSSAKCVAIVDASKGMIGPPGVFGRGSSLSGATLSRGSKVAS